LAKQRICDALDDSSGVQCLQDGTWHFDVAATKQFLLRLRSALGLSSLNELVGTRTRFGLVHAAARAVQKEQVIEADSVRTCPLLDMLLADDMLGAPAAKALCLVREHAATLPIELANETKNGRAARSIKNALARLGG
jgi:hypothetical protein